jgi:hypothetical protein
LAEFKNYKIPKLVMEYSELEQINVAVGVIIRQVAPKRVNGLPNSLKV